MFSHQTAAGAQAGFQARLAQAGPEKERELRDCLRRAEEAESPGTLAAVKWLYANSPLSDLANYEFSLFLSCARHGAFLRAHSPLARELPEDLFLHYVLHSRVNDEELCACRELFYSLLEERVRGLSPREAILEANCWGAEQVTYRSTDSRTASALAVWGSACGRCGEESVFLVNVLRAIGIPARQVYTPRWAHCDDNHAWVEVWCGGGWHFLGACEPEEVLDRGWFTNAAGRALLVHSRRFGAPGGGEEVICRDGAAAYLNHLPRYAEAASLTVEVRDGLGDPVPGAEVSFGVLNAAEFFPAAVIVTGGDGLARLTCGLGSVHVRARKGTLSGERLVYVPETATVELVLKEDRPALDRWEDFIWSAPRDHAVGGGRPTPDQKEAGLRKSQAAGRKRAERVSALEDAARAAGERYGEDLCALLLASRGNAPRLLDFLEDGAFTPEEKRAALLALPEKDWRDIDPDILRENLTLARPYAECAGELYYPCIVSPRVLHEPLRKNRRAILARLSPARQEAFRKDPRAIWRYIRETVRFDPSVEYGPLVTLPVGALTVKNASPQSQKLLFVSICRALGVPARIDPVDGGAEFFEAGRFVPLDGAEKTGRVVLEREEGERWQHGAGFALARLNGGAYRTLDWSAAGWDGCRMELPAVPGEYRLLTDNRLPNGDIYASRYRFRLEDGQAKTIRLHRHQAELPAMLADFTLEEFQVRDGAGRTVPGSELTAGLSVLMWLEEGAEPTEHILNELLARQAEFRSLPVSLIFLVRNKHALEQETLARVLSALPWARVYFDSFIPNVETLARRVYVDHEKLPLILVARRPLNVVYASSGYNAGSGDMVLKVCGALRHASPGSL